jgi:xylulose-5-phosphate/fructose-6-phosphate phosphoketolase
MKKEEGTTTTPFDMLVRNDMDRFHLVLDVNDRIQKLGYRNAHLSQKMRDRLIEHKQYITEYGEDMPDITEWEWNFRANS